MQNANQAPMYPNFLEVENLLVQQYRLALSEKLASNTTYVRRGIIIGILMLANRLNSIPEFRIRAWTKMLDNL